MNSDQDKIEIETKIKVDSKTAKKAEISATPKSTTPPQTSSAKPNAPTPAPMSPSAESPISPQQSQTSQPPNQPASPQTPASSQPLASSQTPKPPEPPKTLTADSLSPSLKEGDLGQKIDLGANSAKTSAKDSKAKEGLKETTKKMDAQVATNFRKRASQAVLRALKQMVARLGAWAAAAAGWPVWVITIILIIVLLIVSAVAGGAAVSYINGWGGTHNEQLATPDSQEVKAILDSAKASAGGTSGSGNASSFHLFDFLDSSDKTAVEQGKIDRRILAALQYLAKKHNRIAVSHLVSEYNKMPVDIETSSTNQLNQNVSAHKRGLAADVAQIDFVTKSVEPSKVCTGGGGFLGIGDATAQNDIVYFADGLPTTTPNDISTSPAPEAYSSNAQAMQAISNYINQIDIKGSKALLPKLQQVQNSVNSTISNLNNDAAGLTSLRTNMATIYGQIGTINTQLNSSALSPEQKAALQKKLDTLNQQLMTASYRFQQLSSVALQEENRISQLSSQLQADMGKINVNLDSVNAELDKLNISLGQIGNFQNISIVHDLGGLNDALNNINSQFSAFSSSISNLPVLTTVSTNLGGSLDNFGGIFGSANELLRLYCLGGPSTGTATKTAIPIKVTWQDDKPDISHVSSDADDCSTYESIMGDAVCYAVFRPQARTKVHQVITELLQFPYDAKDENFYKVTQLVTFSQERDVDPFKETLDKLYGLPRPGNLGLFSMPESWSQVHVGY